MGAFSLNVVINLLNSLSMGINKGNYCIECTVRELFDGIC